LLDLSHHYDTYPHNDHGCSIHNHYHHRDWNNSDDPSTDINYSKWPLSMFTSRMLFYS
jgi:hypothetical protein